MRSIEDRLSSMENLLQQIIGRIDSDIMYRRDIEYRDILLLLDRVSNWIPPERVSIVTDHPVATSSHDHLFPRGTVKDNTRYPRFVAACEKVIKCQMTVLDIGCAGGGLVLDFLLRGHRAFGIEGSDLSQQALRAEWRLLPNNLFTADATKPFRLTDGSGLLQCDLVCAWEVMEHIPEDALGIFLENVEKHLSPEGQFIGSVATFPDSDPETGAVWHVTLHERSWWKERFLSAGFIMLDEHGFPPRSFPRGNPHGQYGADFVLNPDQGFHFVCRRTRNGR